VTNGQRKSDLLSFIASYACIKNQKNPFHRSDYLGLHSDGGFVLKSKTFYGLGLSYGLTSRTSYRTVNPKMAPAWIISEDQAEAQARVI